MFRRIRINTQERAISTDINRLQAMAARGFNETMKHALIVGTSDLALGLYVDTTTPTSPVAHKILRGLLVRPTSGSFNLFVDSGVIFIVDPSPGLGFEDSPCVPLRTDGVTLPGALTITPNSSGVDRFDVIECRVNPTPATVTDNRDIFDPATGLFTAASIVKELEQQVEFRVRAGTAGAGFPGTAVGWAPLCVALVPTGATNNDAVTFWDVRKLAEDQAVAPFELVTAPSFESCDAVFDRVSATSWICTGSFSGVYGGRRVGGKLRRGSPGTDANNVDFFATGNKAANYAEPITAANYYAYLLFPFGLPRWSRYTDASAGPRVPREPKGIPMLSTVAPNPDGTPSSPVSVASIFGGSVATQDGLFMFVARTDGPGFPTRFGNSWASGRTQLQIVDRSLTANLIAGVIESPTGDGRITFSIPAGRIPQNAKAVHVEASIGFTGLALNTRLNLRMGFASMVSGTIGFPSDKDMQVNGPQWSYITSNAAGQNPSFASPTTRIPLLFNGNGRVDPMIINLGYGTDFAFGTSIVASSAYLVIVGFEF